MPLSPVHFSYWSLCLYMYCSLISLPSIMKITAVIYLPGLPRWLSGIESTCSAGDQGSIPGLGRFPRGGNGNPFQYSCLENSMDRGAWQPMGYKELDTTERLSIKVPLSHSTYSVYSSSYTHCYFKHSTKFIFKILKRCFCVFPDWHSTKLHSFLFFLSSF